MKTSVYSSVLSRVSVPAAVYGADETIEGATVDRAQFKNYARSVGVAVVAGTLTDGSFAVTLEVSDDDSEWTTATAAMGLVGTAPTITTSNDEAVHEFGYVGAERYVRISIEASATTDGGPLTGLILLGDARREPIARS